MMEILRRSFTLAILLLMLGACTPLSAPTNLSSPLTSTPLPTASMHTSVPPTPTLIRPAPTITPTPKPQITKVTIDGNSSDWSGYSVLIADPVGDHKGGEFDIAAIRAFTNDKFLYVLIESHGVRKDYVQLDLEILAGTRRFIITFNPESGEPANLGEVTIGRFSQIGHIAGSDSAAAQAVEFRMPLSAFDDITGLTLLGVRPMAGKCCGVEWYAVDDIQATPIPQLNEREMTRAERFAEWSSAPFTGVASVPFAIAEIAGDGTRGLVIYETEMTAYIVGEFLGKLRWLDIDPTSPTFGETTTLAGDLFILNDIAINKAGTLAYVTRESGPGPNPVGQNVISRINLATGQATTVTTQIDQPSNRHYRK